MQYTIAAKPTRYAGVQFRSRLEARWAAFFDLMGWEWHYEPLDLDGWVPDFVLPCYGTTMNGKQMSLLVEVKPLLPVRLRRLGGATALVPEGLDGKDLLKLEWPAPVQNLDAGILLLGAGLPSESGVVGLLYSGSHGDGWCGAPEWLNAVHSIGSYVRCDEDKWDGGVALAGADHRLTPHDPFVARLPLPSGKMAPAKLVAAFAEAGNAVQWHPKKGASK